MSKEAYADSLEHWAKCFRDGTLDDSFANEIAYLLEDKAHDLRIDWQCDRGICEYSDRKNGRCQCYNEESKKAADVRGDVQPTVNLIHAPTKEEWIEIAECIWVGALEGGSNYWIEYIDTGDNDLKEGKEIVEKNFEVIMHVDDGEPQPTRWYRNSFDVIVDGITLLDGKRQAQVFEDIGQLDAYDYDLIIQLGTFGKEVFC